MNNRTVVLLLLIVPMYLLNTPYAFAAKPSGRPTRAPLPTAAEIRPTKSTVRFQETGTPQGDAQSCQNHIDSIKNRSGNLTQFTTRVINTFADIAAKVEVYYTTKVLPGGKPVANYDALLSAISTKKTVVQSALTQAQTIMVNFDCQTGDYKTTVRNFNSKMKEVKSALNDYRTAVRNLIVAVKSQTPEGDKTTGEPERPVSPRPTHNPSIEPTRRPLHPTNSVRPTHTPGGEQ